MLLYWNTIGGTQKVENKLKKIQDINIQHFLFDRQSEFEPHNGKTLFLRIFKEINEKIFKEINEVENQIIKSVIPITNDKDVCIGVFPIINMLTYDLFADKKTIKTKTLYEAYLDSKESILKKVVFVNERTVRATHLIKIFNKKEVFCVCLIDKNGRYIMNVSKTNFCQKMKRFVK